MDSRVKVGMPVPPGATIVRGYFDPLLAVHARALAACARPLAVQVIDPDPPDSPPLLPLEARQLLVAALTCVDCIVPADVELHEACLDWRGEHLRIREEFIRHVHDRAKTA